MKSLIISIIIILLTQYSFAQDSKQITKVVWSYITNPQLLTTIDLLCIENIRHFTSLAGWEFNLITDQNVSFYIKDKDGLKKIFERAHIQSNIIKQNLIQLSIIGEYGGVWIDYKTVLLQDLTWLTTISKQKYINNRLDNPQVVMFYTPSWFGYESKFAKKTSQPEDVIIFPHYHDWFIAARPKSLFIQHWKTRYEKYIVMDYQDLLREVDSQSISIDNYLEDYSKFNEWICKITLKIKQNELSLINSKSEKQYAVSYYKISGISASQSAYFLAQQANRFDHFQVKLFTETKLSHFKHDFRYLLKIDQRIHLELNGIVDPNFPILEHLDSAIELRCKQEAVPFRHIIKQSAIDKFLYKINKNKDLRTTKSYEQQYVKHKCYSNYWVVYGMFIWQYLFPAATFVFYVYITRRAVLFFKPELGISRRPMY